MWQLDLNCNSKGINAFYVDEWQRCKKELKLTLAFTLIEWIKLAEKWMWGDSEIKAIQDSKGNENYINLR